MPPRPWSIIHPADWGFKVSVCLALACNGGDSIITVCDKKVDFGDYSADRTAVKNISFGKSALALFAGNEVEHADPIIERAYDISRKVGKFTVCEIADAVDFAYGETIHKEITKKVLRKRGFDVDTFRDKGKQKCTPSAYLSLCNRIDQVSVSLRFLVCGFDDENGSLTPGYSPAHIYSVDGESEPKNYDRIGMWAIGSGANSAMSWLAYHADKGHFSKHSSLPVATYFALTAKFMAESSGGVGRATFTIILEKGREFSYVTDKGVEEIRDFWEKQGSPPLPPNLDGEVGPKIVYSDDL